MFQHTSFIWDVRLQTIFKGRF